MTTTIEFSIQEMFRLRPDIRNARVHSKKQVEQIAASIAENGFVNPILINPDGLTIAGHGRYRAAKQCGLTHVPTIKITSLTDAQERRLRLADNKIAQNAAWDMDLVKIELEAIDVAGLVMELSGFSIGEIDLLRAVKLEPEGAPAAKPVVPVTKSGISGFAMSTASVAAMCWMAPHLRTYGGGTSPCGIPGSALQREK